MNLSVLKDIVDIYANFFEFIKDILVKAKIPPWQFVLLYAPMILNFFELVFTLISPKPQLEGNYDENYECKVFKVHHLNEKSEDVSTLIQEESEKNEEDKLKKENKKRGKKIIGVVLKTLLAVILVLILACVIYFNGLLGKLKEYTHPQTNVSYSDNYDIVSDGDSAYSSGNFEGLIAENVTNVEDIEIAALKDFNDSMLDVKKEDVTNIFLIGSDTRKNSYEDIGNTDSMILLSINTDKKTLKLTSFMRDMYVTIPNHGSGRLNTAFAYGGPELLFKTLKTNFDVDVDKYVIVNFGNFKKIINKVGGVDIELTKAEARYMNKYSKKYNTKLVEPGLQTLDGSQALSYARCRKIDSDFNRTERQRKVIKAFVEKAKQCNVIELSSLVNDVFDMVYTNVPKLDIVSMLVNSYSYLGNDIQTMNVPIKNSCVDANINGMSVLSPNFTLNKKAIKAHIYSTYKLEI